MNILTFDIEDWYHLLDVKTTKDETDWVNFEIRIHKNVDRIIDALLMRKKKATFFCLGWIAQRHPEIIKKIDSSGFEIASHSYRHQLAYELTPQQFKDDLTKSIDTLQQLTGKKISSFRAPGFSFTQENRWVYDILIESGITTDSSIFPGTRGHGGFSGLTKNAPFQIRSGSGLLKEFPINLSSVLNFSVAFSGGGYFRLLPFSLLKYFFSNNDYIMTYFHPRDFDAEQPVVPGLAPHRKFKSYYGLKGAFHKFERLLDAFDFCDIQQAVSETNWNSVEIHNLSSKT